MANDSGLFRTRTQLEALGLQLVGNQWTGPDGNYLPLIEAKMVHHFDHRFGTYEGQSAGQANQGKLPELDDTAHRNAHIVTQPDCWLSANEIDERLRDRWDHQWLLGWRKITRATDSRTLIASMTPRGGTGDSYYVITSELEPKSMAAFYANLCSFALDYAARQKVGGTNFVYHTFKQLPVLPPSTYTVPAPWSRDILLRDWILPACSN